MSVRTFRRCWWSRATAFIARYKGNDVYGISFLGVEEAYANEGQVDISAGRFFTDEENRRAPPSR